ncbi:hypothetical protein PoB_006831300 [Plakobranchus ocellatus]|uniref:Uncharacterized protein n=1 Tax=Plakobranchus ocellatus TaxID=259542 RepID=A0AAV4DC65_9GAST|nr:hypothetical protein PoB_006831300 [Plakobranchus ocellatus]
MQCACVAFPVARFSKMSSAILPSVVNGAPCNHKLPGFSILPCTSNAPCQEQRSQVLFFSNRLLMSSKSPAAIEQFSHIQPSNPSAQF